MTAYEFVQTNPCAVVRIVSGSYPTGQDFAALPETEWPFDLSDLEGEVSEGGWWSWDGAGRATDWNRNNITMVEIRDDPARYSYLEDEINAAI